MRCAKTNNHTVREAACTCLAELFVKIDARAVEPHLPKIQRTLLRTLKDDSWTVRAAAAAMFLSPISSHSNGQRSDMNMSSTLGSVSPLCFQVRDAASTAYAKAALAFPDACKAVALTEIWPLWLGMLDENVYSVRQHAAAALADVVRAYGQEVLEKLVPILRWAFVGVRHAQIHARLEAICFAFQQPMESESTLLCQCRTMLLKAKEQPAESEESPYASPAEDLVKAEPGTEADSSRAEAQHEAQHAAERLQPPTPTATSSAEGISPVIGAPKIPELKGLSIPQNGTPAQPPVNAANSPVVSSLPPGKPPHNNLTKVESRVMHWLMQHKCTIHRGAKLVIQVSFPPLSKTSGLCLLFWAAETSFFLPALMFAADRC